MDDTAKRRADDATQAAINAGPFDDFRDTYRVRLRWLKDSQPQAFTGALSHYNDVLVPNIAGGADPIAEWVEYGKLLGELSGKGKTVVIDETGRASDFDGDFGGVILHLPEDQNVPAMALAIPKQLSEAQRATLDLLVKKS
jgi:hypothetical protein